MYLARYGHADSHYNAQVLNHRARLAGRYTVNANCVTVQWVFVLQSAHLETRDRRMSTGEKSCRLPSKSQLEPSLSLVLSLTIFQPN